MTKPLFVVISDIHFNINNLELASAALQAAIDKSNELQVPLVIAGDLHDTKAIIRAEVMNRLLALFKLAKQTVYILVGNHDLINEKSKDHGLNYLNYNNHDENRTVIIVNDLARIYPGVLLIPYQTTGQNLISLIKNELQTTKIIVCHQGFLGAAMGDYIQDKSSVDPELLKDYTVISGHYHKHQTIGTVTYIGSPFTHTFGEANDGPKGFLIVNKDGSFTREILNLRKHVIVDKTLREFLNTPSYPNINSNDLVWVKIRGPESELQYLDKDGIGKIVIGHSNFKLDLIPTNNTPALQQESKKMTNEELFDTIIDDSSETDQQKTHLKGLWREITES